VKKARKVIEMCVQHTNQGLVYMIALKGQVTIGRLWYKIA